MTVSQAISSAIIAIFSGIALFFVKDWLFASSQRKRYAQRLLIHSCKLLLHVLHMNPSSYNLKSDNLEPYIDIFLKHPYLDAALDKYLDIYFLWKGGAYLSANIAEIESARRYLSDAVESIKIHTK